MPGPGGYWLAPDRIAPTAASTIAGGPAVSGKPCPRLIAPVRTASAVISAKIVVPNPCMRDTSGSVTVSAYGSRQNGRWREESAMRVALCQIPVGDDPKENLERVTAALGEV